ncbi:MAG: histidine kinase [Ginsengibacter sp.]
MNLHKLIFEKGRYRLLRHLIFWIAWILFSSTVQLTNFKPGPIDFGDLILFQLTRTLTRLLSIIFFCYVTIYYLVPKFILKRKYKQFIIFFFLFVFILYWFNYFILTPTFHVPGTTFGRFGTEPISPFIRKFFSFYSNINFTGAIPACCVMLAIKYYKDWYKKQKESEVLIHENTQAELQLLKAQVHPHFLFNTLNNIYSFALTESPYAAELVDKLSGMIDYMTTEGEKPLVALEKEIQLIKDYIGLEKVRYGNRLNMQVAISGDYNNKVIAPLLMIPFVENCFKHGASKMRGEQWIKLSINIHETYIDFSISNSRSKEAITTTNKKGIGLANVQKRLELLYPLNHVLKIESTDETYQVYLKVAIHENETISVTNRMLASEPQTIFYGQ